MITVKAHFNGRVFVPHEPVDLPAGCELEISVASPPTVLAAATALSQLAAVASEFPANPDLPTDFAAQHDHYFYGTPKRP